MRRALRTDSTSRNRYLLKTPNSLKWICLSCVQTAESCHVYRILWDTAHGQTEEVGETTEYLCAGRLGGRTVFCDEFLWWIGCSAAVFTTAPMFGRQFGSSLTAKMFFPPGNAHNHFNLALHELYQLLGLDEYDDADLMIWHIPNWPLMPQRLGEQVGTFWRIETIFETEKRTFLPLTVVLVHLLTYNTTHTPINTWVQGVWKNTLIAFHCKIL